MEKLIKPARIAFCIGLAGMVAPQYFYHVFGANFFPAWPGLPGVAFWASIFTTLVLAACFAIIFEIKPRRVSLILGALLLAVYIFGYFPYDAFFAPYNNHLGTWADGLKETALAGGAFVIAGSFPTQTNAQQPPFIKFLEKLIPFGPFLFCTTMVLYGVAHFLYAPLIAPMVPAWIPWHIFWTYFAGVTLIGSGLTIILKIQLKCVAFLLGLMIFIWLLIIHIPMTINDPFGGQCNALIGAFSALAFSATAFLISGMAGKRT
jgi:hypothetical protein